MLRITQWKVSPLKEKMLLKELANHLKIKKEDIQSFIIRKKSLDARKKPELYYIYTIDFAVSPALEKKLLAKNKLISRAPVEEAYKIPASGNKKLQHPPIIAGTGPAGLFCGYFLAKMGYCPILLERGQDVDARLKDITSFWEGNALNPESNVQFGEGGAGTFSDGKLNTGVKDKAGRNHEVLHTFVRFGADESILYDGKPHIGTDVLCKIVKNMREEIIRLGGTVLFGHRLDGFIFDEKTKRLKALQVYDLSNNTQKEIPGEICVLAIGHSARDTWEKLYERGLFMEQKPFAVGLRVIHKQDTINKSQYGTRYQEIYENVLPAAPYKLTARATDERGVYSFCMCPGGYVVNASSEADRIAVNGMSYSGRDSGFANSAIVISVSPDDYADSHPLSGMKFQRMLEERAYALGKGDIPVETYRDYKNKSLSDQNSQMCEGIKGTYRFAPLHELFSEQLYHDFTEGMEQFGNMIKDFNSGDTLLCGIESRTSSPVKIPRNEAYLSNLDGIYPCGEGAGYAGGITSAAMDGMKVAEQIISLYAPLGKEI